jgi:hypothetical protein
MAYHFVNSLSSKYQEIRDAFNKEVMDESSMNGMPERE